MEDTARTARSWNIALLLLACPCCHEEVAARRAPASALTEEQRYWNEYVCAHDTQTNKSVGLGENTNSGLRGLSLGI